MNLQIIHLTKEKNKQFDLKPLSKSKNPEIK